MDRISDNERTAEDRKLERWRIREERRKDKLEEERLELLRMKEERPRVYALERDYFEDATPTQISRMRDYIRAADAFRGDRPYFTDSQDRMRNQINWNGAHGYGLMSKLEADMEARGLIYRVSRPQEWYEPYDSDKRAAVIVRAGFSSAPVARTADEVAAVKLRILGGADVAPAIHIRAYNSDNEGREPQSAAPTRSIESATTAELMAELANRLDALERLAATG